MTFKIIFCIVVALVVFLPMILAAKWKKRQLSLRRENDDCYFLRDSPAWRIVLTPAVVLTYACSVIVMFVEDFEDVVWLLEGIALAFTFMGVFGFLVSLLWEVKVEPDALTRYRFPLPARKYKFYEITSVQYIKMLCWGVSMMRLIFYHNGKKLFYVDSDMFHFEYFLNQVEERKRLERGIQTENGIRLYEWKDEFTVMESARNKYSAIFGLIFWSGMLAVCIWGWKEIREEPYYLFYYAFFFLLFLSSIEECAKAMVWKVTVTYREIQVRNSIGRVRSYSFRDITRVEEKDAIIILYVNGKKAAKISKTAENFELLSERLKRAMKQKV